MAMTTEKPKVRRVYVTVADAESRQSKTITIYDTTTAEVLLLLEKSLDKKKRKVE